MPGPAQIRLTEGDLAVFKEVLTSLESHRPSKAERDILDDIQKKFNLPNFVALWSLEEAGFRIAAGLLGSHKDRPDLLRGAELNLS